MNRRTFLSAAVAAALTPKSSLLLSAPTTAYIRLVYDYDKFTYGGVTTGRWSSSMPNFSNIPKGLPNLNVTIKGLLKP